jgi:arylsulfatase
VHWPERIRDVRGLRRQFHHAIDLVPTMLELGGVACPSVYHGVAQLPLHGTSLAYTFDDKEAPSRRRTQYFEMGGQRGIVHDGWKAVTHHQSGDDYDDDRWELYHIARDYTEVEDLAAQEPERLRMMIELWWREARAYGVLPLDDRAQARAFARDPQTGLRRRFVMYPGTRLLTPVSGPNFAMRCFRIAAFVDDDGSAEGVLFAYGRRAAGFSLFVQDRRLRFDYNLAGRHTELASPDDLPAGARVLGCEVAVAADGTEARLTQDGAVVATCALPMPFPAGFGVMSSQCGRNSPSPVCSRYEAPFAFSGRLDRVEVELGDADDRASAGLWAAAVRSE